MHEVVAGYAAKPLHLLHIGVQRMIRQVYAQHLLFHGHADFLGERSHVGKFTGHLNASAALACQLEQGYLPFDVLLCFILSGFHEPFKATEHGSFIGGEAVHGSRLYERFHSLFIYLADIYVIYKCKNILRQTLAFAGFDDGLDGSLSHVLDAQKSESDLAIFDREFFV